MINEPIYKGILQSDLDCAGFDLLNFSGGGGGAAARKFDVKTYGALGDGTTDDTTAIQAALAAIPSTGGVLYFPPGNYKYTGTTLALDRPITVEGDGGFPANPTGMPARIGRAPSLGGASPRSTGGWAHAISVINFNSSTGTLFDVVATGCTFKDIMLYNSSSTAPTAGAGIVVSGGGSDGGHFTKYSGVTVLGFYICVDFQQCGDQWMDSCFLISPVLYGLKIRRIAAPDGGDHFISNCNFWNSEIRSAAAAVRIESATPKLVNCKINCLGFSTSWVNGIDIAFGPGADTGDLLVSNCSIEGYNGSGIKGTTSGGTLKNSVISGNQFQAFGSANPYAINLVGTNPGDFHGWTILGNWADNVGTISSNPMIYLQNCSDMVVTGNGQSNFSGMIGFGSGVAFADSPVYIGRDARLVSITGGAKLQVRNASTGVWVDAGQWTNP